MEADEEQQPIADLYNSILAGDVSRSAEAVREVSTVSLPEWFMAGILMVATIHAITGLVRRSQPLAQPFADAIAENMKKEK